jgi:hypothetical protein
MKKSLALVLGVLLVFGLVLASCDSGGGGTPPKLTVTIMGVVVDKDGRWNLADPKSTFAINDAVAYRFAVTDPDKDVKGYGYTIKKGGEIYYTRFERDFWQINNGNNSDTFSFWNGDTFRDAGTYTIEAYVFDLKNNKSKTATATFTVQ